MESKWRPIETAPSNGVIQLAVEHADGTRRVFVAEASFDSRREGEMYWVITTGWTGWSRMYSRWKPIGWRPLAEPPGGDDEHR